MISTQVAILTAGLLYALRVDLWLAFSVVAFFANFVPNLGAIVAVALPMPVVLIDPDGSPFHSGMAFFSLVLMHALVGNVVEPVFFGHSMRLHPVVVLLSLMIWGFIWGVPGCVLAVPITAVLRIYLQSIDHPLAFASGERAGRLRATGVGVPAPAERTSVDRLRSSVMYDLRLHASRSFANRDPGRAHKLTPRRVGGTCCGPSSATRPIGTPPQANAVLWVVQYLVMNAASRSDTPPGCARRAPVPHRVVSGARRGASGEAASAARAHSPPSHVI